MHPSRSQLLPLLLLQLVANATTNADTRTQFLEAPLFHNSPQCRDPIDSGTTSHGCCRENIVNIAMTLDKAYLRGSMAAVLSIIHHSACPQNLHFHFVHSRNEESREDQYLKATVSTSFPYLQFDMYAFSEEIVSGIISTSVRAALDRPLNYARSYLARLLPECLQRVVYLDSDVILVDDIAKLWSTPLLEQSAIAAPEYCNTNISRYFTPTFWTSPALSLVLRGRRRSSKACYFNTGVMVVDLGKWRAKDHTREIEEWMEVQKRMRIYELGSMPPFLLVFAGKITAVEPRWNQHGLGGDNYEGRCRGLHAGEVSLLHWSGRGKPWVRLDGGCPCPVDALWVPYDLFRKPIHKLD